MKGKSIHFLPVSLQVLARQNRTASSGYINTVYHKVQYVQRTRISVQVYTTLETTGKQFSNLLHKRNFGNKCNYIWSTKTLSERIYYG